MKRIIHVEEKPVREQEHQDSPGLESRLRKYNKKERVIYLEKNGTGRSSKLKTEN